MGQNFSTTIQNIGGNNSALNLTAAALIKGSPGIIYRAVIIAPGGTGGAFTLNDANALVTAKTITGITVATNAVVTLSTGGSTNPFAVGNTISFASVGGMTQINTVVGQVTAIGGVTTAWTVTTNINSSAFSAWTTAGTAASFSAQNQIITIPQGGTTGAVYTVDWPCLNGILLSAVPTASSPILAVAYS